MVLEARDGLLATGLIILDQVTKAVARATEPNNFLFVLTHNTGAGFGILQGKNALLFVISVIVLVFVAKQIAQSAGYEKLAYVALASGIVGNAIDRVAFGAVTDFVSIGTFPVFNVADSLITVSILYLVATALTGSFRNWNFKRKSRAK